MPTSSIGTPHFKYETRPDAEPVNGPTFVFKPPESDRPF